MFRIWLLFCLLLSSSAFAASQLQDDFSIYHHPFYVGALGGYGSTTWQGLVPAEQNINIALSISTPIKAVEGGFAWGFYAGYEFLPTFAVEASYMSYPDATVTFDEMSIFSFNNNNQTVFTTRTQTASFIGKVLLTIPHTSLRLYSSAGVADVFRDDMLLSESRVSPTFGAGANYRFTDRIMLEVVGNYTAGFGESRLNPADNYFPFLYSVTARLAYCFGARL